ncbi:Por secretion system C-terminal sorting domain-containing protein [Epilithonimonas mollis]|uniref:Por secretion system C-terminal sorting domain-containing protein n=1 Tax=Epilithonimonas mollis TaxID=216903 RepID=A0A1M6TUM7_9FLAO|nr:Por secretion system C-terminal sorting domain-containing protein [Epilithonimonas mollis]
MLISFHFIFIYDSYKRKVYFVNLHLFISLKNQIPRNVRKIFTILLVGLSLAANAQTELVFVFFKDKPNKTAFYSNPLSELTQKSLDRRTNLGIALTDQDAPIEQSYIQNIKNLGFIVTDYSKWLNGVAVNATTAQIVQLSQQNYVDHVESFVRNPNGGKRKDKIEKFKEYDNKGILTNYNYGNGLAQIDQINLRALHVAGYTGTGMTIAVIDTGFPSVDTGNAFKRLRDNGQIKGGYNFINKSNDIYNTSLNTHGSICLGTIGGFLNNQFVGTAPDADFYLYASEDAANEIPEEQLYWIEAAEEADRKGVDVISTSLGYTTFDDSRYDYTYEDMNGTTSFIARGAQIATQKGIFVTFAAGNEGNNEWHYVSTPADNSKVFTIGSVTALGKSSSFSSFGPNSVGVIKPDASARGSETYTVFGSQVTQASGTSLANPVAAGGVACLLQSLPKTISREEIKNRLRQNASLYPNYTAQMGYGILNFYNTYQTLGVADVNKTQVTVYPNPAKDFIYIDSQKSVKSVEIFDTLGRLIKTENSDKINVSQLSKGNYLLKIKTDSGEIVEKMIKQ